MIKIKHRNKFDSFRTIVNLNKSDHFSIYKFKRIGRSNKINKMEYDNYEDVPEDPELFFDYMVRHFKYLLFFYISILIILFL